MPTTTTRMPVMLTIPDAAAVLGVHHTTVRQLIHSGELRAKKVGRVWRISATALREFMGDSAPE
jgi:excisionase family DNA binding protein